MRFVPVIGCSLMIVIAAVTSSVAADKKRIAQPTPAPGPSLLSEFRFGFSAQDPWGPESGSGNVTGEVLFAKPFTAADLFTSYFVPRPHVGGSVNFADKTSFAYAGLTWTVDITSRVFVEGSIGGAVHNGNSNPFYTPPDRLALGCTPLFREAGSVGMKITSSWSVMATVEHLSNAGACSDNRGLTNVGARLGYAF